ncbi:MAG TPA: hypothetical protein VHE12_05735 [bacterium]|nr:hypothetical protein [bacterium]
MGLYSFLTVAVLLGAFLLLVFKKPEFFKPEGGINWERFLKDLFQYLLAALIIWLFARCLVEVGTLVVPADNRAMFDNVVRTVEDSFMILVGYFFGSSKGSSEKNALLAPGEDKGG